MTTSETLETDEGGCVTKRFVVFTRPGRIPEKKGGWLKDEHLIDFLRDVMLHDGWEPGFRATVLELTWDNDLWASSASEYLSLHDNAIGPRRARQAWKDAREKHERIYNAVPKAKLGKEIEAHHKLTALHASPDALSECLSALRAIKANGGDPEDVNRATCAIERVEALRFAENAKQAIDPRLTEWGYSTTDEAITHLGKLLEDQAAFDGLASPDKMEKGR